MLSRVDLQKLVTQKEGRLSAKKCEALGQNTKGKEAAEEEQAPGSPWKAVLGSPRA